MPTCITICGDFRKREHFKENGGVALKALENGKAMISNDT